MDNVIDLTDDGDTALLTETGSRRLLGGAFLSEDPLGEYVEYGETPRWVLRNKRQGVIVETEGDHREIEPSSDYSGLALVSDERVVFAVGHPDGDRIESIPLADVVTVRQDDGLLNTTLTITTVDDERWEFPCRGDVTPVREFIDWASGVWSRAQRALEKAELQRDQAEWSIEADDVEKTLEAVATGQEHLARARESAQELDRVVSAVSEQAAELEDDFAVFERRAYVMRGARRRDAARDRWDDNAFDAAYDRLAAALEDYKTALSADANSPPDHALEEVIADIEHELDELSKAPIEHAQQAVVAARDAPYPAVALAWWQRALKRYQSALALDWGVDNQRFAGSSSTIKARLATVAEQLVDTHCDVADAQMSAGDALLDVDLGAAEAAYGLARTRLEQARETAAELAPGAGERVETSIDELDGRWDKLLAATTRANVADDDAATSTDDSAADEPVADDSADESMADDSPTADRPDDGVASDDGTPTGSVEDVDAAAGGHAAGQEVAEADAADGEGAATPTAGGTELAETDRDSTAQEGVSPYVLRSRDPDVLPELVASVFDHQGWTVADVNDPSNDHYDLRAYTEDPIEVSVLVWTVHPAETDAVGAGQIDRYAAIRDRNDAAVAAVASVAPLSQTARERAGEHGIRVLDATDLAARLSALPMSLPELLDGEE